MSEPYITTVSGVKFEFMNPKPEQINIGDIAHALANLCRFGGHCDPFYSVAEHCFRMAVYIQQPFKLDALLHDATEAYLVDVPRPVKRELGFYKEIEEGVFDAIAERFGLRAEMPREVKELDEIFLATEARDLTQLGDTLRPYCQAEPLDTHIVPFGPSVAKGRFLYMFERLCPEEYQ